MDYMILMQTFVDCWPTAKAASPLYLHNGEWNAKSHDLNLARICVTYSMNDDKIIENLLQPRSHFNLSVLLHTHRSLSSLLPKLPQTAAPALATALEMVQVRCDVAIMFRDTVAWHLCLSNFLVLYCLLSCTMSVAP